MWGESFFIDPPLILILVYVLIYHVHIVMFSGESYRIGVHYQVQVRQTGKTVDLCRNLLHNFALVIYKTQNGLWFYRITIHF